MTELLLVRHGETEWNAGEIFRGRADIRLDETGEIQARLLGEYLKDTRISAVYSSPLIRAIRTAQGITAGRKLDILIEPDLTDLNYGEWQGMPLPEVEKIYRKLYRDWKEHPETVKMPGGESLENVKERTLAVVSRVVKRHRGTVVIVSHRVVNKVLICALLGLDNSHFWNIRQDNCGITSFTCEKGNYVLTGHNDISFLRNTSFEKLSDF